MLKANDSIFRISDGDLAQKNFVDQLSFCIKYNETNDMHEFAKLAPTIQNHIEKFGSKQTIIRMFRIFDIMKYVPKNMSPLDLLSPDSELDYINGYFSTFDYDLSKMVKNGESVPIVNNYLSKKKKDIISLNSEQTWQIFSDEYKRKYMVAIDNILKKDQNDIYSFIFTTMSAKLAKLQKIVNHPKITVINSWKELPEYAQPFVDVPFPRNSIFIDGNDIENPRPNTYEIFINTKSVLQDDKKDKFVFIAAKFLYEYTHFVDKVYPNRGVLGEQIMNFYDWQDFCCNMDYFDYLSSAAEKNAYNVEERCETYAKDVFWPQNNEKNR